jgi:selenophosphate synthase
MLKTKVIKNNLDVIFETTHVTTIMEEEVTNVIKTNKAIMDIIKNLHNLVKIVANTITEHQVKQVFKCNANLMIWLAVEDFLIHHKWQ